MPQTTDKSRTLPKTTTQPFTNKNGLIARFIWLKNGLTCPEFWPGLTPFPQ